MPITIPQRDNLPETELFIKILKKNPSHYSSWERDVMVLLHGGPGGNHTLYADIEEDLLEIADLILIDLRGCGLSKKIATEYCTLDHHIDDLDYVLKALGISNPIIHGCSYGALVTLGFSIKYSEITFRQVLSSCALSGCFVEAAKENLKRIGTTEQIQAAEKLWTGSFETQEQFLEYYRILAPLYVFNHSVMLALPTSSPENIPYNIELVNLAFTTYLRTFNFSDDLEMITADTLIFAGKNDWIFSCGDAEKIHSGIKNSLLIKLDKCGHFPWIDQRGTFLQQLALFVKKSSESNLIG